MSTPPLLIATGVDVRLGGRPVLSGVDLEVRAGEVTALVGPNGAGKTTLLGVLAGDLHPEHGEVLLDGRPTGRVPARELARERAVLAQEHRLSFGFRVEEVVRMGRAPWHRTARAAADDALVDRAMVRCDVDALADRGFPTLSGGERARTSLARVLAQDTAVLLLDEPTAALDIHHQESALGIAREAARHGCAVVVVLHDLSLAAAYADRMCLLDGGAVVASGTPAEVLTSERVSQVYRHPVTVLHHDGSLLVVPTRQESTRCPS